MSIGLLTSTIQAAKRFRDRADPVVQNFGSGLTSIITSGDDYSYIGKKKSLLDLVRLSAVVCGIELCYAAETAFVSPILLKFGVPTAFMSLVWCLSPVLGVIAVPLLGSLSDNCKLKFGRRRPFIILLATGIILGLLIVPNGKTLGIFLGDQEDYSFDNTSVVDSNTSLWVSDYIENSIVHNTWNTTTNNVQEENNGIYSHKNMVNTKGIVITIIGVVVLDLSCDAAQSPSRAYLLDVSIPEDHSRGLGTFSIMAGLGGCIGYILGGIDWDLKHTGGWSLEQHVIVVFSAVTIFFIICLVITLTSFKEIPLCEKSAETLQKSTKTKGKTKYEKFTNEEEDKNSQHDEEGSIHPSSSVNYGSTNGSATTEPKEQDVRCNIETHKEQSHCQNQTLVSLLNEVKLKTYFVSIVRMPRSLCILCLTNLFCWMSLVCYSLYFTDFVGQAVYGGNPKAPRLSHAHQLYDDGVRLGSFGMSLYSLACAIYAMFVERLVERFGAKRVYIVGQLVYCVGMIIMAISRNPITVIILSPTAGIMYATLFTMPYMIVANYHTKGQFSAVEMNAEDNIRGLGTDVAIVSSMVFIAQFVLSTFAGSVVEATGTTVAVILMAAILSFLGSLCATQVLYLDL